MTRSAFRLTQRRYQESSFRGFGSLRRNGRWHRAGLPIVYASESPELALLEVMVHVERVDLLTMNLVVIECQFEESMVEMVTRMEGELPEDWRSFPWPASTQEIGKRWFEQRISVVLDVPSAVVPSASNYLINPVHPEFEKLSITSPRVFEIDPRLGHA